jgi:hypothetical protein
MGNLARGRRSTGGRRRPPRSTAASSSAIAPVQGLEYVGMIAAPTTLATALVYWLGFELTDARSAYFDLGVGTLGFSRPTISSEAPRPVSSRAVRLVHSHAHARGGAQPDFGGRSAGGGRIVATTSRGRGAHGRDNGVRHRVRRPVHPATRSVRLVRVAARPAHRGPADGIEGTRRLSAATGSRPYRTAIVAVDGIVVLGCFWAVSIYADALD